MNSQQLQLVTFEQAKRLKELRFDWGVKSFYATNGRLYTTHYSCAESSNKINGYFSAPLIATALKWFRDVKKIGCSVNQVIIIGKISNRYSFSYNKTYGCQYSTIDFDTYEAAESALLDELLTILEK